MDLKKTTHTMERAARAGGRELLKHFGSDLQRMTKSNHRDFYTKADLASEEAGGTVLKLPGKPKEPQVILAATPKLADALAKILKSA